VVALVGQDLCLVVRLGSGVGHVASTGLDVLAPAVQRQGLVPAPFEIGLDPQVVQDVALADEIAELLIDRERQVAIAGCLGIAQHAIGGVQEVVGVGEEGPVGGPVGCRGSRQGDPDAVGPAALAKSDPRPVEHQPDAERLRRTPKSTIEPVLAPGVPGQCPAVVSSSFADDPRLAGELGLDEGHPGVAITLLGGGGGEEPAQVSSPGITVERLVVAAGQLGHVTTRLGHRRDVGRRDRAAERSAGQCSPIEGCSVDVRVAVAGDVARSAGVPERRLGHPAPLEMEGQDARDHVRVVARPALDGRGQPGTIHPVCTTTDALSGVKFAASLLTATARVSGIPVTVATCLGALDVAGNLAQAVVRIYVAPITFSGFQAPVVGPPTVNTGSVGKAYPVRFQLRDAGGAFISALPAITSTSYQSVSCTTFGTTTSALPNGTNASTSLTYDSKANQYVYTWKTPGTAGCYVLTIGLADGTSYKANFKLK